MADKVKCPHCSRKFDTEALRDFHIAKDHRKPF
jgi:hypothetical protein